MMTPNIARASEHGEQAAVIDWWRLACRGYRLPEFALFAVPNGSKLPWTRDAEGRRWSAEANKLKAEGLRSGIPDLVLAVVRSPDYGRIFAGLFIELKRHPNRVTVEQKAVMAYLDEAGYKTVEEVLAKSMQAPEVIIMAAPAGENGNLWPQLRRRTSMGAIPAIGGMSWLRCFLRRLCGGCTG